MLNFFYLSSVVGLVFYVMYFKYDLKKIHRKAKSSGNNKGYTIKVYLSMIKGVILSACIVGFLSFIVPTIIWNISKKEVGISDKIDEQEQLLTLPQAGSKAYVGKKIENNVEYYVINLKNNAGNTELMKVASSSVQVARVAKGQNPVYQKVSQYKIKKLNKDNIIYDSINDMYANVYLDTSKAQYVGQVTKILIPSDTDIISYN